MLTYTTVPEFCTPSRKVYTDGIGLFVEQICNGCGGTGKMDVDDGVDGFEYRYLVACDCCDGKGVTREETCESELEAAQ